MFAGFTASVTQAALDHTEQILFAGSMDKTAKMWALKNNKLLATLTGHIDYVNTVQTFYSSQRGLTGSSDRTIKEWDFNTLKLSRNVKLILSISSTVYQVVIHSEYLLMTISSRPAIWMALLKSGQQMTNQRK